nr:helix-turn-helix domain-containing protein [Corynebacterium lemuris]
MVADSFTNVEATFPAPDFTATARFQRVGDVELYDMETDPHTVIHSDRGNRTMCKFSLQLKGVATLVQDDRTCEMKPGDFALYTGERPYHLVFKEPQRSLVVYFPRNFLHLRDDQIDRITATPISRHEGLGKVAVPLFEQLARNLNELQGPHAQALVRASLDLLVTVVADHIERIGRDSTDSSLLFRQAVKYIEEHSGDPLLSPSTIARALYVSVRSLHTHFSDQGMTVATYIRSCRLRAIHGDLANPQFREETVQSISARHGLIDASYVSKAFRSEYGESPRDYRSRILS